MGIRFYCPNGHKLNVKEFQAGRRGICPFCGARTHIPTHSTRPSSKSRKGQAAGQAVTQVVDRADDEDAEASDSSPDILPGEPPDLPGDPGYPLAGGGKMPGPSTAPGNPTAGPVAAPPAGGARSTGFVRNPDETPPKGGTTNSSAPATALTPAPALVARADVAAPPLSAQGAPKEPPDPIAEAPEMIWYIRPPSGGQFGPAPGELMRTWLSEGRVSADSLVWREGWRDWLEAGTVFPKLRGNPLIDLLETAPQVTAAAAPAAHAHRPKVSRSSDRSQLTLLAVLSLAVAVLIFVLVYMLMKP
jgi:hypothetical protein